MIKAILDEARKRLIKNHKEEYVKIKYECQNELIKYGSFLR